MSDCKSNQSDEQEQLTDAELKDLRRVLRGSALKIGGGDPMTICPMVAEIAYATLISPTDEYALGQGSFACGATDLVDPRTHERIGFAIYLAELFQDGGIHIPIIEPNPNPTPYPVTGAPLVKFVNAGQVATKHNISHVCSETISPQEGRERCVYFEVIGGPYPVMETAQSNYRHPMVVLRELLDGNVIYEKLSPEDLYCPEIYKLQDVVIYTTDGRRWALPGQPCGPSYSIDNYDQILWALRSALGSWPEDDYTNELPPAD